MNKHIYFDGKKSIELSQYPDEAWTWLTGQPDEGKSGIKEYFKAVPWLFRGVNLRANAVSKMPFNIYRGDGDEEIDTGDKYENVVKFLPNPKRTFKLIEMSLSLLGVAYLFNVQNRVLTLDLKYLNPTTITPIIDEEDGLIGFKRQLRTTTEYSVEDIIHLWLEDPYTEIGEPTVSPAKAALMASGVLANVDEFVAAFFQRGAVKATIFSAQGMSRESATEFENWWTKLVTGVQNSWRTKVLNTEAMVPTIIGEGIEGLQDQNLTKEKREDISTALGVPQSLLWSSEAGGLGGSGVVTKDDYHFYDKTIIPECELIQYVLNKQVFEPNGYRLKFLPETIDIMQEDEKARAMALGYLFNAEVPLDIAMKILGFEMDEEYWKRIEEQVKKKEERAEELVGQLTQGSNNGGGAAFQPEDPQNKPDPFVEKALAADLRQWKEKAVRQGKRGEWGKVSKYESENIPPALEGAIAGALDATKTVDEIMAVFGDVWMGYP
jgi:HK97 family phage portal protein